MKIENFSVEDSKKALNQSKRGKLFSVVSNVILLVPLGYILGKFPEVVMPSDYHGATSEGTVAFMLGGIIFGIFFLSYKHPILTLTMFGIKPTVKDMENYVQKSKKMAEKRLQWIDSAISSLAIEKQEIQARFP